MAKTFTDIPSVAQGDVYTSAAHNLIAENINNYRVPPMCHVSLDSFSLAVSGTAYFAAFDSTDLNTGSDFTVTAGSSGTTAASAGKVEVSTSGVYLVTYNVEWASNSSGLRRMVVGIDGTINPNTPSGYGFMQVAAANGGSTAVTGSVGISITAGSYIQIGMAQTSGGALTVNSLTGTGYLQMHWLGQVS